MCESLLRIHKWEGTQAMSPARNKKGRENEGKSEAKEIETLAASIRGNTDFPDLGRGKRHCSYVQLRLLCGREIIDDENYSTQ